MAFVRAAVASATIAWTIPAPILLLALRSAADVAVFPQFRDFSRWFGEFCSFLGIFASIPWLLLWCTLFCSICLFSTSLSPTIASLLGFGCGLHLWWSLFMCVGFLSFCDGGALSSFSPPAGGGVGSCCASFGVAGAPAVFRCVSCSGCPSRVLHLTDSGWLAYSCSGRFLWGWWGLGTPLGFLCQRSFPFHCFPLAGSTPSPFCCLPFAGAASFQAPVCGSTPAVVPCGWVGGVFVTSLGFLPCTVLFLRGLQLAQLSQLQGYLGVLRSPGVCPFASLVT